MVGEGHGRGARSRPACQDALAACRPGRSTREADQSGEDEGAAVMKPFALAITVALLLASPLHAQQPIKLRVGYDGFSMTSGPLNYADKQGVFKKFGLDVAPTFIEGGSMVTTAVVGRSLDIAQNGYTPAMAAAVA